VITPVLFGTALFAIGTYGVLGRRNLLIVLMSLELMLNGVNVVLVAFSRLSAGLAAGAAEHGQVLVMMVMAVAAAEVAVGLALVIAVFRTRNTLDTARLDTLSG
jgi:NADH-quinone oxidoreductase subunit K